jgi:prepilin-type processing-associated H-X9-DG protein
LKQLALGVVNYESAYKRYPRGNEFPASSNFQNGDQGASWLFVSLPFMEQSAYHDQVRAATTMLNAFNTGVAPPKTPLPMTRCPSDNFESRDGKYCNYVGSSGPQCNNTPTGSCDTPIFQKYCNAQNAPPSPGVPPALATPTYPGYEASATWGSPIGSVALEGRFLRGMFARGGSIIKIAHVTDGTSNTIMLGEILPEFSEFQRYTQYGWLSGNNISQGQTIQPINWSIDPMPQRPAGYTSNCSEPAPYNCPNGPTHCMWNWHVTWGFHSRHPGGANFAFADGTVRFIEQSINHQMYQYLGCRHDNQPVTLP